MNEMSLFDVCLKRAREIQQQYYATSGDWNVFSRSEPGFLKNYVGLAIYGEPKDIKEDKYIYEKKQEDVIEKVFCQIMKYSDQTELIYCNPMYCITFETEKKLKTRQHKKDTKIDEIDGETVTSEEKEEPTNETVASKENDNIEIGRRTFFRIRRERVERGKLSEFYFWFVDWDSRVYETWEDFLNNNNLHPCTMVVPKDGEYQADPQQECSKTMTHVLIEHRQSPACKSSFLNAADVGSSVLQVASFGLGVAAVFTPIAPIALTVGAGVGLAASSYSTGRTISNLVDRGKHKESLTDRRAVGDYISIGGNVLGAASLGASKYITTVALKGEEVGRAARIAHDCVVVGSVACKGTEIGHKIYGMYNGDEEVTVISCISLAADIFFISNIVVDIKTAKELIRQNQTGFIENHKKTLTKKRHRNSFNKMARKADNNNEIIQRINKIKTPEELAKLAPTNTFSASKTTSMNGSSNLGYNNVFADIRREWPAYSTEIIKVITSFVLRIIEMLKNGDLNTKGKWYSLIVKYLWDICKPVIREMTRKNDFVKTLYLFLEQKLDSIVSEFAKMLKTEYQREREEQSVSNTNNFKDYGLKINDFAVSNDLSVTSKSVKEIKKIFEEVDTNMPDDSESFVSALMQMSLFIISSVNICDVKSYDRAFLLAISFLWDKFQEMMIINSIMTADDCVLKLFDNSEEKLTEMVQDFEVYLLRNL